MSEIGEHALIARITGRLAMPPWVVIGPGDDAAVIEPERGTLDVLTTDAHVDGVHFDRRFVPPDAIGHRALAVNLSDLAAMGAQPRAALLSLVLPGDLETSVVDGMLDGWIALAARYRVALIGGNITRSPGPLVIDVTAIGSVRPRRVLTRTGARPGDEVYVTGTIGGALVGLQSFQAKAGGPDGPPLRREMQSDRGRIVEADPQVRLEGRIVEADPQVRLGGRIVEADLQVRLEDRIVEADLQVRLDEQLRLCEQQYLRPEPRVRAGMLLGRNRAATACMDLSDGLADGIRQLAAASNAGILLDEQAIPLAAGVREYHCGQGRDPVGAALAGGDDYELLFTARPSLRGRLRAFRQQIGDLPITKIGVVTKGSRLVLRTASGDRDLPAGFEHFR